MILKKFLLGLVLLTCNTAFAAVFTDVADFLADAGNLDFESFEALPASNENDSTALSLSGFELTTSAKMGVFSGIQGNGTDATDGSIFVQHYENGIEPFEVTFTFVSPITAFGLTTTDLASSLFGGDYTMITNAGDSLLISDNLDPNVPDGQKLFSGIVNLGGFTAVSLKGPKQGDAFGMDGVYYSTVPIPAAAWLFGSALLGLAAVKRRKEPVIL